MSPPSLFPRPARPLSIPVSILAAMILSSPLGMAAGLIGWWNFENNLLDGSGNGLHGSPLGSLAYDGDLPPGLMSAQSLRLDQDTDGVRIKANAALNATEFTLGYFINLLDVASANSGLERLTSREGFAFETAVGNAAAVGGTTSPTGVTLSYYSPSTGWQRTQVEIPLSGWIHVAWQNSTTKMKVYLNGELAYTGQAVTSAPSGFMNIGTAMNNGEGFSGLMDDVFLWDNTLTASDIKSIAQNGVGSFSQDADGDGLPKLWELQYGLDPNDNGSINPANGASGNPDNDGLSNAEERTKGTNPTDPDTDRDGLADGPETTLGTDPLIADTDGDGLSDSAEVTRATNPLLADSDSDWFGDAEEVAASSDPLNPLSLPPPASALVLHLNLEGDAQDSSAQANHGTLLGNPAFLPAESPGGGQAIALTANDMGIEVPAHASLSWNVFTLSYWIKPTSLQEGAGLERLTGRAADGFETAIGNRAALGGAPDLTLSYFQGTGWHNTGTALELDTWSHITWRSVGEGDQDMTLFLNGQPIFSGPGVPLGKPGNSLMRIGNRYNDVEGFAGLMDDVRLYRAGLADSFITTLASPVGLPDFQISNIERTSQGDKITLTFYSRPGRKYAIDYSTDMKPAGQPGGWIELTDSLDSAGSQTAFEDTITSHLPKAFYQVRDVTP